MVLAREIDELRREIEEPSSLKERAFYRFLVGEPMSYPDEKDLTDKEQVCLSIYCKAAPQKNPLIDRLRQTKPIKGIHYSKNLIELFAMALDDLDAEREHLKTYCNSHSTRDHFVLARQFPGVCSVSPAPQTSVDRLVQYLIEKKVGDDWKLQITRAMQEANDLVDIFVIEQAYQQVLDRHPITKQVSDCRYFRDRLQDLVAGIEQSVDQYFAASISIVSLIAILGVGTWAWKDWDTLEPVAFVGQVALFIASVLLLVFRERMVDSVEIMNQTRESWKDRSFSRWGISRREVKRKLRETPLAVDRDAQTEVAATPAKKSTSG